MFATESGIFALFPKLKIVDHTVDLFLARRVVAACRRSLTFGLTDDSSFDL